MKKLLGFVALLVALMLPSFAAADVPVPVDTGVYDNGVYVQVHTQRVFDEEGVAIGKEVTGCHVHIFTLEDEEHESVGEEIVGVVTTADFADAWVASATVAPRFEPGTRDVVAGRAVFTVPAGAYLDTVNTDPTLTAVCPAE